MDIEAPCEVSVAVTTDAPDRVAITTSPVVIPANQWLQVFHFTVTAIDDNLDNGDVTPTVTTLATSGSEFYSNFSPAFSLTVLDNDDPAPQQEQIDQSDPTPSHPTAVESTLASTGSNQSSTAHLAIACFLLGAYILFQHRSILRKNR